MIEKQTTVAGPSSSTVAVSNGNEPLFYLTEASIVGETDATASTASI